MISRSYRLFATFTAVAVVVLASTFVVYWMGLRVYRVNTAVYQRRQVVEGLERTLSALKDAESSQRGFLLTGDDKYLEPYTAAPGQISSGLEQLQQWAAVGRIPPQQFQVIARLAQDKLDNMAQTIALRQSAGIEPALAAVRLGVGKRLMDDLRRQIEAMEKQQEAEFDLLRQQRDQANLLRTLVTAIMAATNCGFLVWAFRRIRREMASTERQRELLAVTLGSIGDGVIVTDARGQVTFLNPEAQRLTGWQNQEACGQSLPGVFRIINEETRQAVENPVDKVLRLGTVVGLANHTLLIARDGRETPIDDSGAPIRADGAVHGVVLVFRDSTAAKRADKALRESEERLNQAISVAKLGIFAHDHLLDVIYYSPPAREIWSFGAEEPVTLPAILDRVLPEERAAVGRHIQHAHDPTGSGLYTVEHRIVRPDGSVRWISVQSRTFFEGEGAARRPVRTLGAMLDITERKQSEEALRQSEQRLRAIFDNAGIGIVEVDGDDRFIAANDRVCQVLGYCREEMLRMNVHEITHPDDRPRSDEFNAAIHAGRCQRLDYEKRYLKKDGSPLWVHVTVSGIRDAEGRWVRSIGTLEDISERKRAQEALAAAKLSAEQAKDAAQDANKAKDHFLAVLSHELRTPLTPVVASLSLLQQDPRFDADTRESLEMISRNVELEARLIDDLLDITRIAQGKVELDRQAIELGVIIRRAAEVCLPDIEARKLEFGIDAPDGPYWVDADGARLQQVFWNLIKNAIKFTPKGGCVGVRCRRDEGRVVTEVKDSGKGLEADLLPRLFNAFEQGERQTTRQFGGLGLGLAISKTLVELHQGKLTASSEGANKGATFVVTLPLLPVDAVVSLATPAAGLPPAPARALRILLVEDHGDTARIVKRLLTAQGHEVARAGDVASALKLAEEQTFDLLLSDLGLPDASGLDLMRSLREKGSPMPGIAISGYGQEQDRQQSREAGFLEHLVKPVSLPRLQEAIARVVG